MSGKILILSWCNADNVMNYGQILQAIAMMQLVRSDYDGEIDYISYHPRTMKNKIRCILERYSPLSGHLMPYCKTKEMINKVCKENNVKLYQISNAHKLEEMSSAYNLMICGSDQIWHREITFRNIFLILEMTLLYESHMLRVCPRVRLNLNLHQNTKKCENRLRGLITYQYENAVQKN